MFPTKEQIETTKAIHSQIVIEKAGIEAPWLGTLPFCMDLYGDGDYAYHTNVLDFMQTKALAGQIMRFPPLVYSPVTKKESLDKLVRDICLVSRDNGVELVCTGGIKFPMCKSLMCSCSLIVDKKRDKENNGSNKVFRDESLHNDRKNNRHNGHQKLLRRCTTKRRMSSSDPMCTFRLNIYVDDLSFYLKIGSGSVFHCHHAILDCNSIRLPSRFVSADNASLMRSGREASLSVNTARNLFYIRSSGELLSKSQIATIMGKTIGTNSNSVDIKKELQDYFEKENAECCFLYHRKASNFPIEAASGLNEYHSASSNEPVLEPAIAPDSNDAEEMCKYATMNRRAQGIDDTQDVFLAVAWVLPAEKRLFQLFPFVLHLDSVEDTNNEKRPLFTVTGRDSMGNMFTVLRAFLPNQCAWVFRWLFQSVFPRFFGLSLLNRISIIVTDGDSQETTQLDIAIKLYFPAAYRARCIWHIIDRGMHKYFPRALAKKKHGC
jgi:hypothetical protein